MRLNDNAGLNVCKELHERSVNWFEVRTINRDRDSVFGTVTRYGLGGPGIEFRWGARFSAPIQTGPGVHPASCTMGTGRDELNYLAPLGSENISAPYFKQCFFRGWEGINPPRLSQTPRLPVPRQK